MSTPLDHPLRQTIAAMARTTDALVELARRIDEAGLGPAHEGQEIASMANSEQWEPRAVTDNAASPAAPAPSSQPTPSNSQTGTSPRRWWLNVYSWNGEVARIYVRHSEDEARKCAVKPIDKRSRVETVPVVEASAYDAAVRALDNFAAIVQDDNQRLLRLTRQRDAAQKERDYWRDESLRQDARAWKAEGERDAAVRERDVALTEVERLTRRYNQATRDLAYYRAHVVVKLEEERDAARAELASARRLTPEVVERAIAAWNKCPEYSHIGCMRAALLAAGFQEVDNG